MSFINLIPINTINITAERIQGIAVMSLVTKVFSISSDFRKQEAVNWKIG